MKLGGWALALALALMFLPLLAIAGFAGLFLWSWATYGTSTTELDKEFEQAFAKAFEQLPPLGESLGDQQVAEFFEPLLGFAPVAICQNDGFDYGGVASKATKEALAKLPLPAVVVRKFENTGEDAAAPDFKTTMHFISKDGVAHSRSFWWSDADCQVGESQCARVENLTPQRTEREAIRAGWNRCPLREMEEPVSTSPTPR